MVRGKTILRAFTVIALALIPLVILYLFTIPVGVMPREHLVGSVPLRPGGELQALLPIPETQPDWFHGQFSLRIPGDRIAAEQAYSEPESVLTAELVVEDIDSGESCGGTLQGHMTWGNWHAPDLGIVLHWHDPILPELLNGNRTVRIVMTVNQVLDGLVGDADLIYHWDEPL